MHHSRKTILSVAAALALSACGTTTTSTFTNNTTQFTQDVLAFNAASQTLRTEPLSTTAAVVNAGGTYTGTAQMNVLGSGATPTYLGAANLTANIAAGTVSGTLSNFRGGTDATSPETLAGTVTLTGQSIGVTRDSRFVSAVSGTLTGPQTSIILGTGNLNGDFRASPTTGLFASGAINGTTLNGVSGRSAVINVVATK